MKNFKLFRVLAVLVVLITSVPQANAWYYITGDPVGGWTYNNPEGGKMNGSNNITFMTMAKGTYYFKLYCDGWGAPCGSISSATGTGLVNSGTQSGDCGAMWVETNDVCNITFQVVNSNQLQITVTKCAYYIKYPWNGGSYVWSGDMKDNGDGTYSVRGKYGGRSYNYGRKNSDGGADTGYMENAITTTDVTFPDTGDDCIFTYTPSDHSLSVRRASKVTHTNYFYFDNSNAQWSETNTYFVIGNPEYSTMYGSMTGVTNTKLMYGNNSSDDWDDVSYYAMAAGGSTWDGLHGWNYPSLSGWAKRSAPYLTKFDMQSGYLYLIGKENGTNDQAITLTEKGYVASSLNSTQTIKYAVATGGTAAASASELTSGTTPATLTISSYKFTDVTYNSVGASSSPAKSIAAGGNTRSTTETAAYTATTTVTVSSVNAAYRFKGFYESASGGSAMTDDNNNANDIVYYPKEGKTIYARFVSLYSVSYNVNGGTGTLPTKGAGSHESGTNVVLGNNNNSDGNGNISKSGYTLNGWNTAADWSGTHYDLGATISSIAADATLYAEWKQTVALDREGGAEGSTSLEVRYNTSTHGSFTAPTKEGYDFAGYYTGDDGTGSLVIAANGTLQANVVVSETTYTGAGGKWAYDGSAPTLYAKWTAKEITVTLDKGDYGAADQEMTINYDAAAYTSFTAVSATGYDVEGYYDDTQNPAVKVLDESGAFVGDVTGFISSGKWNKSSDCTLTAHFTPTTYNGTIDKNGGTSDGTYSVTFNDTKIVIEDGDEPVNAGYEIEEYHFTSDLNMKIVNGDKSLVTSFTHDAVTYISSGKWAYDGDITLYPKWGAKTYTITLDENLPSGTTGVAGTASFTAKYGTNTYSSISSLPTAEGYTFAGYYTDDATPVQVINAGGNKCTGTSYIDGSANWVHAGNITLYAHWTDNGTYVFKGEASGNATSWSTAANWTKGVAPSEATDSIVILAPVVVPANATTSVKSVRIATSGTYTDAGGNEFAANGKLTIPATAMLKVTNDVKNYDFDKEKDVNTTPATLHIKSEEVSTGVYKNGALVWGTAGTPGGAQVDFCTKSSSAGNKTGSTSDVNQYIGTPFSDESNYYNYYNAWVFKVNDAGTAWERLPMGTGMDPFVGYNVIYDGAAGHVFEMDGMLVTNANKTCELTHNNDDDENLLANSWTAPMWIKGFVAGDFVDTDAAIYIFKSTSEDESLGDKFDGTGNYESFTPGTSGDDEYIPSMQSFSVLSNGGGSGSVTLNYANLVQTPASHENIDEMYAPRRYNADDEEPAEELELKMERLKVYVSDENGWGDLLKICIREDFVEEFENGFDARKMYGDPAAPTLYGISPDGRMAINCIPTADNHVLGFHAGSASNEYTFRFTYDGEDELYLRDNKTGIETPISAEDTYTFTSESGDSDLRFSIIRKVPATPTDLEELTGETLQDSGVQKIMYNGKLYIIRGGRIYDATGAVVK